jgi:hypothetical protein
MDYLQPALKANVVTAARKLNTAAAWLCNIQSSWYSTHCVLLPAFPSCCFSRCFVCQPSLAQIDYLQPIPKANVVTAAQKLITAAAWMYTVEPI